jgi:hypothetical protein
MGRLRMKLQLDNPVALHGLRDYLSRRSDYVVQERGPGAIAVSVLGSFRDGGRSEIERYLRPWRDRNDDVTIRVLPDA